MNIHQLFLFLENKYVLFINNFFNPKNVKRLGLSGLDIRLSFRDLFTVSNYSGWDPETNMMQNRITGEDYFNQPQTWGANLSLYLKW